MSLWIRTEWMIWWRNVGLKSVHWRKTGESPSWESWESWESCCSPGYIVLLSKKNSHLAIAIKPRPSPLHAVGSVLSHLGLVSPWFLVCICTQCSKPSREYWSVFWKVKKLPPLGLWIIGGRSHGICMLQLGCPIVRLLKLNIYRYESKYVSILFSTERILAWYLEVS